MCHSRTSSVIPVKTGIQSGLDPQSEALRFRLRMTGGFRLRMTGGFRLRMTGGDGSRIKYGMTKRNVDPQSEALCFRLRITEEIGKNLLFQ